jgi:hypothetical protein
MHCNLEDMMMTMMIKKMISFFSFFHVMEHRWNVIDRGKQTYSGKKTCPNATLSTTNPTWTDPESNPGLRGERPATNRLSHDTAQQNNLPFKDRLNIKVEVFVLPCLGIIPRNFTVLTVIQ